MNERISISKAAFSDLFSVFLPRDDDSGPLGPVGPVIRDHHLWGLLNPQPLPPRDGPQPDPWQWIYSPVPDPWRVFGPSPDPWNSARFARFVITHAVVQYQLVESIVNAEQLERSTEIIQSQLRRFVDEFCGTRPPRFPWPWSPKFNFDALRPIDFFVAGSAFQRAGNAKAIESFQETFSDAADQLFEMGLKRLESHGCENTTD